MGWGNWILVRPDALTVWRDPEVRRRLSWYLSVMNGDKPPKFKIAMRIDAGVDSMDYLREEDEGELWRLHNRLQAEFKRVWSSIREGRLDYSELGEPKVSFLDLKIELSRRLANPCRLCERRCWAERLKGKIGACRVDDKIYVHSAFLHMGEEAPLVPSGTIFYGGCNFTCVFCQNNDISQGEPRSGIVVDPPRLAAIQDELAERGARNINHVGGDPTPHTYAIIESLKYVQSSIPQLWNSNFYMSLETMKLLVDVIDIWLPDFKYGNNKCAVRLSAAPRYFEVVTRNLRIAAENGDMIIRHLVLPNHVECCTRPVLKWIAENLPKDRILVNVMEQYRPENLVLKHPKRWPDIARRPRIEEIVRARRLATELGILWEPVS